MSKLKTYRVLYRIEEGRCVYIEAKSAELARERVQEQLDEGADIDGSNLKHGEREVIDVEEVES